MAEYQCPECGADMVERTGQHGTFYGCTKYKSDDCRGTRDADGQAKGAKKSGGSPAPPPAEIDTLVDMSVLDVQNVMWEAVQIVKNVNDARAKKDLERWDKIALAAKESAAFIALMELAKHGHLK